MAEFIFGENEIKVFIAGGKALLSERDTIVASLSENSNKNSKGILIRAFTYRDFNTSFIVGGRQVTYEQFIEEFADYVIFVLDNEIGDITEKEFNVAMNSYMSKGKPVIYVYHNSNNKATDKIENIIRRINDAKQYYTDYDNIVHLRDIVANDFWNVLDKYPLSRKLKNGVVDIVDNLPTFSNDANIQPYKIRVNRPCRLEIDGDEIAVLDELKLTKISLPKGKYLRKVVAIDNNSLFDETEIEICETSKLDNIILSATGLEDAKRNALPREPFEVDDLIYEAQTDGLGVVVVGGVGEKKTDVVIPEQIVYMHYIYEVKEIGERAFSFHGCESLRSVAIPHGVIKIGDSAFSCCESMISIIIPKSVISIGEFAFSNCHSLSSIAIPDSVTNIGSFAFNNCSSLTMVTIPNGVKGIVDNVFRDCTSLESINIPNSVVSIGAGAFRNCLSLKYISIPNSVKYIGHGAFRDCFSLNSITIPESVIEIEYGAFCACNSIESIVVEEGNKRYDSREKCNAIIDTITNTLITGCTNTIILNSVTSIGDWAFNGCSNLMSIVIPNSVTNIGVSAFCGCSSLTSINIPDCMINIDEDAFRDCSSLQFINIPNATTNIGDGAFCHCSCLESITIPNSVTRIGDRVFQNCSNLTSIGIPDNVQEIGELAFSECQSLISITIPNGVLSIGDWAFADCTSLTSINIPDNVTSIGNWAFSGCSSLVSIIIPDKMISIGEYMFYGCSSLTSIVISNSVKSIGYCAFMDCSSLVSISIPSSVTSIDAYAFSGCYALPSIITIPNSVKEIGKDAFPKHITRILLE